MMKEQMDMATKAVYATLGAPVVVARQVRQLGEKFAEYSDKLADTASARFDDYAREGEKVAQQLRGNNVVEEIQHRVDLDKVTDRVEKLRDQLEAAMQSWRESFTPGEAKPAARKVTVEVEESVKPPATGRTTVSKPRATTTGKASAAKSSSATARKSTAARKAAAKSSPSKTSATKTSASKTSATKATTTPRAASTP